MYMASKRLQRPEIVGKGLVMLSLGVRLVKSWMIASPTQGSSNEDGGNL